MVDIYQISLHGGAYDARGKTAEQIYKETGCEPLAGWRDPLLNRPILAGEIGCAISHMRVWEQISTSGRSGLIIEEDAVYEHMDLDALERTLQTHDSAWLGYRENTMGYWYNAHAYAITAETATYLLSQGFHKSIVPVDEFLPFALTGGEYGAYRGGSVEKKRNYFYDPPIVKQITREKRPSTIEGSAIMSDNEVHLVTVATDAKRAERLQATAAKFGWPITFLGINSEWSDDMTSVGGFPKIEMMRNFVDDVFPQAIILFMDGYDTFINDDKETVIERFLSFDADLVIGAEATLWPDWDYGKEYPQSETPYRYLNSGQYIGRAGAIKKFLEKGDIAEDIDDQAFFHEKFLSGNINVTLDYECYIFQNYEPKIKKVGDQLYNPITNCCPCTYHGNGGALEKKHFDKVYNWFYGNPDDDVNMPYYNQLGYEVVADEILVTKLLSKSECERLIELSEDLGTWEQMAGDKFPAQEIRIKELGLWGAVEQMWAEKLGKIAETHWPPVLHYGLRDAFTMRYTMDTQTSLALHTDASLITGSVKLNDEYEGAELVFPRQSFSNIDVPVGHCILFPAQVTHGHRVEPLVSGTKYSFTMWTGRYKGDVN